MRKRRDPKNRLMESYIAGAATYATLVKIEHFTPETPSGAQDFEPLVVYSLNKKRRWEIRAEDVHLENTDDVKAILFERELRSCQWTWWSLNTNHFHNSYYYSLARDGREVENAKKEDKVVGYHVVRVAKSYKKMFDNSCFRYMGLRYPDFLGYTFRELLTPLEYEMKENEGAFELAEERFRDSNDDEVSSSESSPEPSKFYNLEDHFVVKRPRGHKGWHLV